MSINPDMVRNIVEGALLAAGEPVSFERLLTLFDEGEGVGRTELRTALADLQASMEGRGLELKEVGSGWRMQVREDLAPWISRLWEQRAPRYTRALLETLAVIAYQQPVTRSDIEQVRGVSVSSNIIKTLLERDWVRILGHRDVPGRPALYGTTRVFLDYFNLRALDELPPLAEIRDLDKINQELGFEGMPDVVGDGVGDDVAADVDDEAASDGAEHDAGSSPGTTADPAQQADAAGEASDEPPEGPLAEDAIAEHTSDEHTSDEDETDQGMQASAELADPVDDVSEADSQKTDSQKTDSQETDGQERDSQERDSQETDSQETEPQATDSHEDDPEHPTDAR